VRVVVFKIRDLALFVVVFLFSYTAAAVLVARVQTI
jgi:hypothetical protein